MTIFFRDSNRRISEAEAGDDCLRGPIFNRISFYLVKKILILRMNPEAASNINKYYLAHIFSGASLTVAIAILYYLSFGLNFLQIGLLESAFLLTTLLFEIPTGALADKFGRKKTIFWGAILSSFSLILIGLGSSFVIFLLAQLIYGVGASLQSGASAALIYDFLIDSSQTKAYSKIEGRSYTLFSLFGVIAAPIGAHIFVVNHRLPFFIDGIFLGLVAVSYFFMHERTKNSRANMGRESYISILTSGIKQSMTIPSIRWYIIFGILLSVATVFFNNMISQPILLGGKIGIVSIGYIFSFIFLVQAIGSFYSHTVESFLKIDKSLLLIFFLSAVSLIGMESPGILFILLFFSIYHFVQGYQYPVLKKYIQSYISRGTRATVLSAQNFFESFAGLVFLPILGYITDITSVKTSALLLGVLLLGVGYFLFILRPKTIPENIN